MAVPRCSCRSRCCFGCCRRLPLPALRLLAESICPCSKNDVVASATATGARRNQQSAEYGDNFKDCLHKSTFHEVACTRQEVRHPEEVLRKPTFREMACRQLARCGGSFKAGLHKPTFREMAYKLLAKFGAIQGWSSQAHLPEDGVHAPMEADNFKNGSHKPAFHETG